MAATARMSIALPVELKGRMKAAEKGNAINLSKTCQQRIESELAFLEGKALTRRPQSNDCAFRSLKLSTAT
jgi:hypothetical protein